MSTGPLGLPRDHILVQATKFLGVGLLCAATHYGTYVGLVALAGLLPLLATLVGFLISTILSYVLNARFTFEVELGGAAMARFWAVTITGGALNAALVETSVRSGIDYRVGGILAIVVAASFNFLAHRFWTFSTRHDHASR